jgi:uncharacterized protein
MLRSFRLANHKSIRHEQELLLLPVHDDANGSASRPCWTAFSSCGMPSGLARHEPSTFVVDLDLDGVRHTYGFSVDDAVVREEWLYSYPERKRRIIFERTGSDISLAPRANFDDVRPVHEWFDTTG